MSYGYYGEDAYGAAAYGEYGWGDDYGHAYAEEAWGEEPAILAKPATPKPCANGPGCQFLAYGTCKYFHTDEEWEAVQNWCEQAAASSAPTSTDSARRWNVLVNNVPTPAKALTKEESTERTASRSPRRTFIKLADCRPQASPMRQRLDTSRRLDTSFAKAAADSGEVVFSQVEGASMVLVGQPTGAAVDRTAPAQKPPGVF